MPSLEIHIPISPTRRFWTQVHFLVHSIRKNGGKYKDSKVVVTLGDRNIFYDLPSRLPWTQELGVELRWLSRGVFENRNFYATAAERFRYDFESDAVLMLDGDTILLRPIDDVVDLAIEDGSIKGVIAYASPLHSGVTWSTYWRAAGLAEPVLEYMHPGFPYLILDDYASHCPIYLNLGMIVASSPVINKLGRIIYELMDVADSAAPSHYRCQIGLALAIAKTNTPCGCLPVRYNFANDVNLEALHPGEMDDCRLVHYMSDWQRISRSTIFTNRAAMETFLERTDLVNINQKLAETIRVIMPAVVREQQKNLAPFNWEDSLN